MMSPESTVKFPIISPRKWFLAELPLVYFSASEPPHSSLPTSAMWLMEHFSLVTSCTKFSLGNRADLGNSQVGTWHCCWQAETEEQPGSYKPNEKRFCTPLSNSSCLQELIIAALTVALFTLLSLGSLKQYHQNMCLVLFCELGLNMQTFTNLKLTDLIHVIFT